MNKYNNNKRDCDKFSKCLSKGRTISVIRPKKDYSLLQVNKCIDETKAMIVKGQVEVYKSMFGTKSEMLDFADFQLNIFYGEYDHYIIDTKHYRLFILARDIIKDCIVELKKLPDDFKGGSPKDDTKTDTNNINLWNLFD